MAETRLTGPRRQQIARTLQLDQAAIQILTTLSSQNIPALLLKGASFWEWLYPNEGRSYVDVDILATDLDHGRIPNVPMIFVRMARPVLATLEVRASSRLVRASERRLRAAFLVCPEG